MRTESAPGRRPGVGHRLRRLAVLACLWLPGLAAASGGGLSYAIDSGQSQLRIVVYRAGLLKAFGHDHLISNGIITGGLTYTTPLSPAAAFRLSIPVDALVVDDPRLRQRAGGRFSAVVPDKDRRGTRRNMLSSELLDAAHYPDIVVSGHWLAGPPAQATVALTMDVRGRRSEYRIPVAVSRQADRLLVTGTLHLVQSALGIAPFSILGGALRVADGVDVSFTLAFVPEGGVPQPP